MPDNTRRYRSGSAVIAMGIKTCSKGYEIDYHGAYLVEFGVAWKAGSRTPDIVIKKRREQRP